MNKIQEKFNLFFIIYLTTALIGSNIAIGAIAASHLTCLFAFVYYIYNRGHVESKSVKGNNILNISLLIIVFIALSFTSILYNIEEYEKIVNTILKFKYFLVILIFLYLINSRDFKINLISLSNMVLILSSFCGIYGYFQYYNTGGRIGSFAGVMNYSHNLALMITFNTSVFCYYFKSFSIFLRVFYIICFLFNIYILYLTFTRGSWLAIIFGLSSILIFSDLKLRIKTLIFLLLFCFLHYGINISSHILGKRTSSNNVRYELLTFGVKTTLDNPLFGVGYKRFGEHYKQNHKYYGSPSIHPSYTDHAHNTYIETSATTGVPAFLIFILLIFYWIKSNFRDKSYVLLFVPAIICIVVSGLTHHNFGIAENLTLITVFLLVNLNHISGTDRN